MKFSRPTETHRTDRIGWLRAAVLGANDGLVSTAGLVAGSALVFLAVLGAVAAHTGGAGVLRGAWRVAFWGALAMGITAGVGALFGAAV